MSAQTLARCVAAFLVAGVTLCAAQDLIIVENDEGAVCLDGTFPAIYFRPGSGDGARKWVVLLQGGAWCYDERDCAARSRTRLGSSSFFEPTCEQQDRCDYDGIMSDDPAENPDFHNWNQAYFMYCDGASFAGNAEEPIDVDGTMLYFRGLRIIDVLLGRLLDMGLDAATDLVYSGISAGGLAVIMTLDHARALVPVSVKMRGLSDCGWFIDVPPFDADRPLFQARFAKMFEMQGMDRGGVSPRCIAAFPPEERWKCAFPEYLAQFVETEIFMLNSPYDTWQLGEILQIDCLPPNCPPEEQRAFEEFHDEFMRRFLPWTTIPVNVEQNGWFINSCLVHGQLLDDRIWNHATLGTQTAAEVFGNYYFNRSDAAPVQLIDSPYPSTASFCPIG